MAEGTRMSSPRDGQTFETKARPYPSGQRPVLAPSPITGLEPLTPRTFRRLAWLSLRNAPASPSIMVAIGASAAGLAIGSTFIASQSGASSPFAVAAVATPIGLVAFLFLVWIFLAVELRSWSRDGGWVVGYFTANSSQLVHPVGRDWVLTDHYTAHRGRGEAGAFRRHVFAHLAREADLHGVGIRLDTRVPKLADLYVRDMPGLELTATRRDKFTTVYSFARSPRALKDS